MEILKQAASNIRTFHEKQVRQGFALQQENGVIIGQKITPIEEAGLYVPGGTAAYPSTVLMDSIPAKIAGCKEICIATPPGTNGKINPVILAAASSYREKVIDSGVAAIGEVGLTGEIRAVSNLSQRLSEVHRLGFTQCLIPRQGSDQIDSPAGLTLIRVRNIREAIETIL